MWHVSSRSGVATLRTAVHLLVAVTQRKQHAQVGCRQSCGGCGVHQEEEAARAVLQGADARAGATIPPAALPVGARARTPRPDSASHLHAGNNILAAGALVSFTK